MLIRKCRFLFQPAYSSISLIHVCTLYNICNSWIKGQKGQEFTYLLKQDKINFWFWIHVSFFCVTQLKKFSKFRAPHFLIRMYSTRKLAVFSFLYNPLCLSDLTFCHCFFTECPPYVLVFTQFLSCFFTDLIFLQVCRVTGCFFTPNRDSSENFASPVQKTTN